MRTKLRFALAALTAAVLGGQPVFAQAQPEAELKKAQEQLEKLLKELKDREAKKAEGAKPVPPTPPAPPAPPALPTPAKPMIAWAQAAPHGGDATTALKLLTTSKDPKVASMAKELLEHLSKTAPQAGKPIELHLELAKPAASGNGGVFEFKAVPGSPDVFKAVPGQFEFKVAPGGAAAKPVPTPPATTEGKVERRVVVIGDKGEAKTVEGRVVVIGDKGVVDATKSVTVTATTQGGASTLKLSADGKTAALLSADGTITIFDVATGKETMKFSGKR